MEEFINTDKNNTEIDGVLESSLKDFLEDVNYKILHLNT